MNTFVRKIAIAFSAGTFGGISNFIFGVLLSVGGVFQMLSISLPPPQLPAALYQRLVWGGIWGAILFVPKIPGGILLRGFIIGIPPSLVAGLIVFPNKLGAGVFGIGLGTAFPLIIFAFNWVWGIATIWFSKKSGF